MMGNRRAQTINASKHCFMPLISLGYALLTIFLGASLSCPSLLPMVLENIFVHFKYLRIQVGVNNFQEEFYFCTCLWSKAEMMARYTYDRPGDLLPTHIFDPKNHSFPRSLFNR